MFGRRTGSIARFDPAHPEDGLVAQAAAVLADGGVVAFPTDTVYGLGCRPDAAAAVRRIYRIKGRPRSRPLVLMVTGAAALDGLAGRVPPAARALAAAFWPGPLTMVLPASPVVARWGLDRQGTVGLRHTAEPAVNAIMERLGSPLATTSANASGGAESLTAEDVARGLAGTADLILDGGPSGGRVASTVVDLCGAAPVVLRKGALPRCRIEQALGMPVKLAAVDVMFVCTGNTCRSPMAEGWLRHALPKEWRGRVTVHSSGTGALPGMPATDSAVAAARRDRFDIGRHRSTLLTDRLIRQADLVVAMEERHRRAVRQLAPDSTPVLLSPDGVPDPVGGDAAQYREALELIKREMPDVLTLIGGLLDPAAVRR